MTKEEQEILGILASAFIKFKQLEVLHQWDELEFMHAIHIAQNIIMARENLRAVTG